MKYLGIDYGDRKVGLAIGDDEVKIASPYSVLVNNKKLLGELKQIIQQQGINQIIVGVPLGLNGSQSDQFRKVRKFILQLEEQIDSPIIEEDEKLTSAYAQRLGGGKMDDDVAAMLILQSYFDKV